MAEAFSSTLRVADIKHCRVAERLSDGMILAPASGGLIPCSLSIWTQGRLRSSHRRFSCRHSLVEDFGGDIPLGVTSPLQVPKHHFSRNTKPHQGKQQGPGDVVSHKLAWFRSHVASLPTGGCPTREVHIQALLIWVPDFFYYLFPFFFYV